MDHKESKDLRVNRGRLGKTASEVNKGQLVTRARKEKLVRVVRRALRVAMVPRDPLGFKGIEACRANRAYKVRPEVRGQLALKEG